jgi:membrane protease YdiL (CAAX protease family)
MTQLIEPLIVYAVLFFPSFIGVNFAEPPPEWELVFSAPGELLRVLCYDLPALALIWYLYRGRLFLARLRRAGAPLSFPLATSHFARWLPRRSDLLPALLTFLAVAAAGVAVSLAAMLFAPGESGAEFFGPTISGPAAILALIISCLSTGFMEEGFFRAYLWRCVLDYTASAPRTALITSLLFALPHLYEGPAGCANALLCGLALAASRAKGTRLAALALSHAAWNALVWCTAG